MNFQHLAKFANLIKDLKYEHQSIFPLWWRVKLNFRDRKMTLWCVKKTITHPDGFV